jgi:crossover junction endodeoxyribonuclease RusA
VNLSLTVVGQPAPQGSKRHVGNGVMVESSAARVKSWREDVRAAALAAIPEQCWEQATGPVEARLVFGFQRPKSHYRTGKNASEIRADAPMLHAQQPDLDKLIRSTCDALVSAGAIRDDKLIAKFDAIKVWHEAPSCALITITPLDVARVKVEIEPAS